MSCFVAAWKWTDIEPEAVDFEVYWAAAALFYAGGDPNSYIALRAYAEGNLGGPWIYPPWTLWALWVYRFFDHHTALVATRSLALVSIAGMCGLWWAALVRPGRRTVAVPCLAFAVALFSNGIYDCVSNGNIDALVWFLLFWGLLSDAPVWRRSIAIGASMGIKLTPAVFAPLYLVDLSRMRVDFARVRWIGAAVVVLALAGLAARTSFDFGTLLMLLGRENRMEDPIATHLWVEEFLGPQYLAWFRAARVAILATAVAATHRLRDEGVVAVSAVWACAYLLLMYHINRYTWALAIGPTFWVAMSSRGGFWVVGVVTTVVWWVSMERGSSTNVFHVPAMAMIYLMILAKAASQKAVQSASDVMSADVLSDNERSR